jgi:methionyl-tRNA formyltransferase
VSQAPKIKKEDGRIDWNQPAKTIWHRLRAFTPWPGAFTFLPALPSVGRASPQAEVSIQKPQLLKIWNAEVVEHSGEAGTVLSADKNGIVVGCGQNALRILELQIAGGRRMNAAEFLAGHALKAGEKFSALRQG